MERKDSFVLFNFPDGVYVQEIKYVVQKPVKDKERCIAQPEYQQLKCTRCTRQITCQEEDEACKD